MRYLLKKAAKKFSLLLFALTFHFSFSNFFSKFFFTFVFALNLLLLQHLIGNVAKVSQYFGDLSTFLIRYKRRKCSSKCSNQYGKVSVEIECKIGSES